MADYDDDAITLLQEQLGRAKQEGNTSREVEILLDIGHIANQRGNRGLANMHFHLASKVIRATKTHLDRLHEALGEQGVLLRRAKRFPEAVGLYDEAMAAAREHAGSGDVARWLGKKGAVLRLMGQVEEARELHRQARELYVPLGESGLAGIAEQEGQLGLDAIKQEDNDLAEEHYTRAFEMARAAGDLDAVNTWGTNLGNAWMRRRLYHAADGYYEQALKAALELKNKSALMNTLQCWVQSLRFAHRNRRAAELQLETARTTDDPNLNAGLQWQALADLERECEWAKVREVGEKLLPRLEQMGADPDKINDVREKTGTAIQRLGQEVQMDGDSPGILDYFVVNQMARLDQENNVPGMEDVAHLICDVKMGLPDLTAASWNRVLQETHLMQRVPADAMLALCKEGESVRSLEISQRLKAPAFAMAGLNKLASSPAPHREARAYMEAVADLREAVRELERPQGPRAPAAIEHVRAAGLTLLERGNELRDRDPVLHARLGGVVRPEDLVDVFPAADPVGVIDLFVTAGGTLLHVILREGKDVRVIPMVVTSFTAEDAANLFQVWMEGNGTGTRGRKQTDGLGIICKTLHDKLMCGLAKKLAEWRIPQFILIPDILTRHLPLHLSYVCGKEIEIPGVPTEDAEFLCEAIPIEYAPCLQAVAVSQYLRRPRNVRSIFALNDPKSDLAGSRSTAEWLRLKLPDELQYESVSGEKATLQNLERGLSGADMLLIGTHGQFNPREPQESHLLLHDGPWKMVDMMDRPIASRSQVIILSACEVGAVAPTIDDSDASGIPGTLVAAGTASVLASLWPVEDISMGYLIEQFLSYFSHKGYRPSAALFRAVRKLRKLSRDEALERCEGLLGRMEDDGTLERCPQHWVFVDNLAEWIRGLDPEEKPFAHPSFWGGVIIVGSGWGAPAGAVVGPADHVLDMATFVLDEQHAGKLLDEEKYAEARERMEKYLEITDGIFRAKTLFILGQAIWRERGPWDGVIARRKALSLLGKAEVLARAEQDAGLAGAVSALLREMDLEASTHV